MADKADLEKKAEAAFVKKHGLSSGVSWRDCFEWESFLSGYLAASEDAETSARESQA